MNSTNPRGKKIKDKRRQPRWLQELIASRGGFFWLPCPLCGENFGGHEWSEDSSLMIQEGFYKGVCDNCTDKAKRMNKKNFPN